jgi:hypothetical protein
MKKILGVAATAAVVAASVAKSKFSFHNQANNDKLTKSIISEPKSVKVDTFRYVAR